MIAPTNITNTKCFFEIGLQLIAQFTASFLWDIFGINLLPEVKPRSAYSVGLFYGVNKI
jgi:hypothetical protein